VTLETLSLDRLRQLDEQLGWVPERHQIAPSGDWAYWVLLAGRGAGKTDAGAHFISQHVAGEPCLPGSVPHRVAIAAPTLGDARLTCVKGESGILSHDREAQFVHLDGEIRWPNGAHGRIFGAFTPEDVERWRGPQHCLVWADELAAWRYLDECWDQMRLGLRLGQKPRVIVTTTGKPRKLLKRLLMRDDTVVSRATTRDNPHLSGEVRETLYDLYRGTRMEKQELGGEIVEDIEGALWKIEMFDRSPAPIVWDGSKHAPAMKRIVVAVDPAVTSKATSDETGIVVAGLGTDGFAYVLADESLRGSPAEWASAAVRAYHRWQADRIVAESNNGGEMVALTITGIDQTVPVKLVTASQGKRTRAEPVVARYEQGRVRHPEPLPGLEEQMLGWSPGNDQQSPDRVDALVWALTELLISANPWAGRTAMSGVA
jgi:phage terminase large subunit-like protein